MRPIMIGLSVVCVLSGCAAFEGQDKAVKDLERQVLELKAASLETNARLDELNHKFGVLLEKTGGVPLSGAPAAPAAPRPEAGVENAQTSIMPPEGLVVVSLDEDGGAAPEPAEHAEVQAVKKRSAGKGAGLSNKRMEREKSSGAGAGAGKADEATVLYSAARESYMARRPDEARAIFESLVQSYPKSDLADNALYWIGETYFTQKNYKVSAAKFTEAARAYPAGNKAPDALLMAGQSYARLGDATKQRALFDELIKTYPKSEAAGKAKKTLEKAASEKKEGKK